MQLYVHKNIYNLCPFSTRASARSIPNILALDLRSRLCIPVLREGLEEQQKGSGESHAKQVAVCWFLGKYWGPAGSHTLSCKRFYSLQSGGIFSLFGFHSSGSSSQGCPLCLLTHRTEQGSLFCPERFLGRKGGGGVSFTGKGSCSERRYGNVCYSFFLL